MKYIIDENMMYEMANINPQKSGLPVIIWSDHGGVTRKVGHNIARIKVGKDNYWVEITIEAKPQILSKSKNIKQSEMNKINQGIDYVGRNYKTFLKHFNDVDFSFDDEDLFNELRNNGQYK